MKHPRSQLRSTHVLPCVMIVMMSGPNKEWDRSQNSLLMMQRVDLWCAGEAEVERALQHLMALGKRVNEYEPDFPDYIEEYFPGAPDFQN